MSQTSTRPTFDELIELVERLAEGYLDGDVSRNDLIAAIDEAYARVREYDQRIKAVITRVLDARG